MSTYKPSSPAADSSRTHDDLSQPPSGVDPTLKVSRPRASGHLRDEFGRYRIVRQLGQGGMGTVYLAHDSQLDRPVALKVPHFAREDDAEVLERFLREAKAAATLHHPNICSIYDVGQIDGVHYLTMSYLEGQPLSALIEKHPKLSQRGVADLVRKLAAALYEAHSRGVVHRDLKPANIMIDSRHEPVIMDFGLARRTGTNDPRLTTSGAIMGTPAYMSPEQVLGEAEQIGPASDIYSLGVILYELLTGRLPFEGSLMHVLAQIAKESPVPLSRHRPDLDPALEAICLVAMSKDAKDRYRSMDEFAAALAKYLGVQHQTVRLDSDPTDKVQRTAAVPSPERDTHPSVGSADQATRKSDAVLAEERLGLASQLLADLMARHPPGRDESASRNRLPSGMLAALLVVVMGTTVVGLGLVAVLNRPQPKQEVTVRLDVSNIVYQTDVVFYLDGRPIDREKLNQELQVAVGPHKLEVKRGDEVLQTRPFTVGPQDDARVVAVPPPRTDEPPAQNEGRVSNTVTVAAVSVDPTLAVWVDRNYGSTSNPLHSVLSINGKQAAKFEKEAQEGIARLFQPGWNKVTLDTTPQVPAAESNHLKFHLGPVSRDAEGKERMSPVLWQFDNGAGWTLKSGKFTHQLGPDTKAVRLSFNVYYAGLDYENIEVKEGDFVLVGHPNYGSSNPSVTASVVVNGRPLSSFASPERQVVITSLLKKGTNEIKLISKRVENVLEDNDVGLSILGPAEWNAYSSRFEMRPVAWFSAMTGWRRNKRTGQLVSALEAASDTIERSLTVHLPVEPKATPKWTEKPVMSVITDRNYGSTENPLHSELRINGQLIGLFTSDSREMIAKSLKTGDWNEVTLRTKGQHPAADMNHLKFEFGPMQRTEEGKLEMSPILWYFQNGDDWKYTNGKLVHSLGPDVQDVTLTFRLFFAGLDLERKEISKGDYVLSGAPQYGSYNPSVTATVYVNGTPLSSFAQAPRQVVVTSLLKPGTNEIRIVSARVKNSLSDNDVQLSLGGPAEYDVTAKKHTFPVIQKFDGLSGWTRNKQTGQLVSQADPAAETVERVIKVEVARP